MIHSINSRYAEGQKSIVMDSSSSSENLKESITNLGSELGKKIIEDYFSTKSSFETPMSKKVERIYPDIPLCAIITTSDDFLYLGRGISAIIKNSISGSMDFDGIRGKQALNSEIRHMELPEPKGQNIHTLIIAKAVLATGCTAISLTKTAMNKYMPRNIIIASVFYSKQAIAELNHEVPNADIIVVGTPDTLDDNSMLVPGVGNLDKRLSA
jgi:uracil phosphoribosyltransferase